MGGACLRGDGHHRPAGGAGRAPVSGRQQGDLAGEPGAVLSAARRQYLRPGGDADAVRLGDAEEQPDAVSHLIADGNPVGDRDPQRLGNALSIAQRDGDAITIAERQREGLDLALVRISSRPRRPGRSNRSEARSEPGAARSRP
jgi:hypothetical protein